MFGEKSCTPLGANLGELLFWGRAPILGPATLGWEKGLFAAQAQNGVHTGILRLGPKHGPKFGHGPKLGPYNIILGGTTREHWGTKLDKF